MSIPLNADNSGISSLLVANHFLPPDDLDNFFLLDYENGGIALNDPSEGLNYQTWTLRYFPASGDMVVEAPTVPQTILFNRADITEISLAFDQNMNPFVAFVEADVASFWWFDTQANDQVFSILPVDSRSPRCCIDDKRPERHGTSDIILTYIRNDILYERMERQRYTVERTLQNPILHPVSLLPVVIIRVGMNQSNRLQWLFDLQNKEDGACAPPSPGVTEYYEFDDEEIYEFDDATLYEFK